MLMMRRTLYNIYQTIVYSTKHRGYARISGQYFEYPEQKNNLVSVMTLHIALHIKC